MEWYELPMPGRNARCLCGSGRKVKHCCRYFYETPPQPADEISGQFLSYERMYAGAEVSYDGVARRLAEVPGPWLIQCLAKLSWFLGDELYTRRSRYQLAFLNECADPLLARKALAWLATNRSQRVLHRCTIPAMMRVLLVAHPTVREGPEPRTLVEVAELVVMCNDLLERDYEALDRRALGPSAVQPALAAAFFRNGFYSHKPHWGSACARQWALFMHGMAAVRARHPGEWVDVHELHERHLGLTPEQLLGLTSAIIAHYEALTREAFGANPGLFAFEEGALGSLRGGTLAPEAGRLLARLSRTYSEHASAMMAAGGQGNVQHFFSLYDAPLMRVGNKFYPLDMEFLRAQTTEGAYWGIVKGMVDSDGAADVNQLHAAFGRAFEWYCSELASRSFADASRFGLWVDWRGDLDAWGGGARPDIVLKHGNALFVIEVTASSVRPGVAVSADPSALEDALKGVWFGKSPKLRQLERVWSAVREKRACLRGLDLEQVARVIPVLVSLRYVPQHLGTWHWYRDLMATEGLSGEFVRELRILDAEDWEEFCGTGSEQGGPIEAWNRWAASAWRDCAFDDFRSATAGGTPLHPVVAGYLREYQARITAELGIVPKDGA